MKRYAVVKDSLVVNVIIFDDDVTSELLTTFTQELNADELVLAEGHLAARIGGTWDGVKFTSEDGKVDEDFILVDLDEQRRQEHLAT
jgi:hypothetical protein